MQSVTYGHTAVTCPIGRSVSLTHPRPCHWLHPSFICLTPKHLLRRKIVRVSSEMCLWACTQCACMWGGACFFMSCPWSASDQMRDSHHITHLGGAPRSRWSLAASFTLLDGISCSCVFFKLFAESAGCAFQAHYITPVSLLIPRMLNFHGNRNQRASPPPLCLMQPHYDYKFFLSLNSVDQNVGLVSEASNPGSAFLTIFMTIR